MGRWLRRILVLVAALLVVAWGVGSLDWRSPRTTGPLRTLAHVSATGPLRAAAARVDITPSRPTPLAGYAGRYGKLFEGVVDPVFARALVLQAGDGARVALVSAELILITAELRAAVAERTKDLGLGGLVVLATHTHAGPGGYARGRVQQVLGMGGYDAAVETALADGIARAVREAAAAPMSEVALQAATLQSEGVAVDRHGEGLPAEAPLTSARFVADGDRVAARVVVFGMHPTTYTDLDFMISGDWPGAAMRKLEEDGGGAALFVQGAGGDVTYFRREEVEKDQRAAVTGFRVAQLARATGVARGPAREVKLDFTEVEVGLPAAEARGAPWLARRFVSNVLDRMAPRTTRVARLSLVPSGAGESRLVLQFVPGEPVSALGKMWGAEGAVVGLANDYIGYIETPERVAAGEREAVRTYFGPSLAGVIEEGLRATRVSP